MHTDIGNHMIGAKVNGKYVMASHQLANAEIVDILTYDGPLTRNLVARHQVCYEMLRSRVQITVALLLPFALLFPLPFPLPFPLLCSSLRFAFPFAPFPSLSPPPPPPPPAGPLSLAPPPLPLSLPPPSPPPPKFWWSLHVWPYSICRRFVGHKLWHTVGASVTLLVLPMGSLPQLASTVLASQVHWLQGIL